MCYIIKNVFTISFIITILNKCSSFEMFIKNPDKNHFPQNIKQHRIV